MTGDATSTSVPASSSTSGQPRAPTWWQSVRFRQIAAILPSSRFNVPEFPCVRVRGGPMTEFGLTGDQRSPRGQRRRAIPAALAAAMCTFALITGPASASVVARTATPHFGRAVALKLPANAGSGTPIIESASCPSATSCTLAGQYTDNSSVDEPMVVTRSGGHWARAVELRLPSNADTGLGGLAESVSCSRAASCVAVGNYRSNGQFEGFTAAKSNGSWHQAKQVRLPTNAGTGGASISGVSCTG